ncbi:MAG: hypothetical protein ACD_46C00551G0002 [uncultured bacterium]|nr:MAG: hypothetical protein ACD_46C00551G0002 [uncultured bacterium]
MMTTCNFNFDTVHYSWHECIKQGLSLIHPAYLNQLYQSDKWLPGPEKIFNAFSLPINQVNYILFGESPYPRRESANGYAFWDAAVKELWSQHGLSKQVNRATSLRNIIKMLLTAEGLLDPQHTSQEKIAVIDKSKLVKNNQEFFTNFLGHGFLLLNATLVLQDHSPQKDARAWYPFMQYLLHYLLEKRPQAELILFGRIANAIEHLIGNCPNKKLYAEHPYNHSFITNPNVILFFKPLHLLLTN